MDAYSENDERAFPFVDSYILKAKNEKNIERLVKGYEHAVYYSRDINQKFLYADSAIFAAVKDKNSDLISRSYLGKGIIFYYNKRQYKPALDQYIKAFQYSKNSEDDYLKNKIIYHLGMVKSYLGYYSEAAKHFSQSAHFFENQIKTADHPTTQLNYEAGYFNSVYRLSTCYKNLHRFDEEDSLITLGLVRLEHTDKHPLAYGYFNKGKGIQLLRKGHFADALKKLLTAKKILSDQQDYASLTTVYFYLGKLYAMKNDRENSLSYFNKVDSLLNKFWFVTPEIRSNYVYLINDAKRHATAEKQLYYMDQLLKVDSIITVDFAMLSSKMYHEYDSDKLLEDKNSVINNMTQSMSWLYGVIGLGILTIIYIIWRFLRREKSLKVRYEKLVENYATSETRMDLFEKKIVGTPEKSSLSAEKSEEIKMNLEKFEDKKLYLTPNLTILDVAKMIDSNRTHLSYVLNDHFQMSFPIYLKTLRIDYITKKLLSDHRYLTYKIDTLATECGIANRQLFSRHFLEITGIRPADFIRKRKEELEKSGKL